MPVLRIELETTREAANTFHARAVRGEPFITERDMVIDQVWAKGYTPTGTVHYRGVAHGQPPALKFDAEVHLD